MTTSTDRSPITMALMGGLGNQLFQFAAGLQIALNAKTSLRLDLAWFDQKYRRSKGLILRPYELDEVAQGIEVYHGPTGRMVSAARHAQDVLLRRIPSARRGPMSHRFYEDGSSFDRRLLHAPAGSHLSGYFASWRYFPEVVGDVRDRIRSSASGSSWLAEEQNVAHKSGAIGFHVRRGDYLTLSSTYGHVQPVYYSRALSLLRRCGHDGPVWLFSDEPDAARHWLDPHVRVDRVVKPPPRARPIESLVLMSSLSALAIANSTFSWWSAFLEDAPARTVVAPRPTWASEAHAEPRDSLLPHWLTLDCRDI